MKLRILLFLALALVARADVFSITSAPFNDGHSSLSPYNSLLNGQAVQSFCLEYGHNVGFNTPYDVTVVNLHNFSGALHDNFWQAGWLALQLVGLTDIATISDINRGIWLITTPGTSDPYLTTAGAFYWANQAALNYQSVSDSSFTLILRSGEAGQAQLLIGCVPEPEMVACFILGGVSLVGFNYLGRRQRAKK